MEMCVCTGNVCVHWKRVCALETCVCTGNVCVHWKRVCALETCVCTGNVCVHGNAGDECAREMSVRG